MGESDRTIPCSYRERIAMKILIVDDDTTKTSEVRSLLTLPSCEIDVATSGVSARGYLDHTRYDLLILDFNLPFRDGDEPDRRGGMNLLIEVTISDRFVRPSHVVALTGFVD